MIEINYIGAMANEVSIHYRHGLGYLVGIESIRGEDRTEGMCEPSSVKITGFPCEFPISSPTGPSPDYLYRWRVWRERHTNEGGSKVWWLKESARRGSPLSQRSEGTKGRDLRIARSIRDVVGRVSK